MLIAVASLAFSKSDKPPSSIAAAEREMAQGYSKGDFSSYRRWMEPGFHYKSLDGFSANLESFLKADSHFHAVTGAQALVRIVAWKPAGRSHATLLTEEEKNYSELQQGRRVKVTFKGRYRHFWHRTTHGWRLSKIETTVHGPAVGKVTPYPKAP